MSGPSLGPLSRIYFRLGAAMFGGGDPAMAALQREFVERRAWLTMEQHGLAFGLARVTPGTNILAYCAATGWMLARMGGAAVGVAAVCVPSAVAAALFAGAYETWGAAGPFRGVVSGLVAGAVGMTAAGGVRILTVLGPGAGLWRTAAFAGGALALSQAGWLTPVPILVLAAVAGMLFPGRRAE